MTDLFAVSRPGLLALESRVGILTIPTNDDGTLAAGTDEALLPLVEALDPDKVRVLILTGDKPDLFIRHYSVESLLALSHHLRSKGKTFDEESPVADHAMNQLCRALETSPIPVIAALGGTAMGGGWELAMACDIRIAAQGDHRFGLPEINIGLLPGAGGTQRLARIVGTDRALEMILNGRTVGPDEALGLGMVHEVADDALARAREIASDLSAKPQRATAHIKKLVRRALPPIDDETLLLESRLFLDLLVSDEAEALMSDLVAGKRTITGEPV